MGLTCPCARWQHVLLGLRFQELSWDHTFPEEAAGSDGDHVLWLEFDGQGEDGSPVNKLLKIYSKQVSCNSFPPPTRIRPVSGPLEETGLSQCPPRPVPPPTPRSGQL